MWSDCTADCGPGFFVRNRACNWSEPSEERGKSCRQLSGEEDTEHKDCNIRQCAEGKYVNQVHKSYNLLCYMTK